MMAIGADPEPLSFHSMRIAKKLIETGSICDREISFNPKLPLLLLGGFLL
jgi:hypothetical protein